jgi:hypothetical protein
VSAGYSQTPLWKKLGLREGSTLLLLDAPEGWDLPELPAGVASKRTASTELTADVVLAFFGSLAPLRERIHALGRMIFPAGAVWIAWPRRAAGHDSDIREQDIRDVALPLGLVDVKVAAIDEDWSGLRLVWRVEHRGASTATRG